MRVQSSYKCQFCGEQVPTEEIVFVEEKRYHQNCAKEFLDKKELEEKICELFHLKGPGPRNYKLMNYYRKNLGLTYKGMTRTLIYFFEVKKNDKSKANEGIGIVPHVYDEAKEYYRKQAAIEKRVIGQVRKNIIENQGKENAVEVKYKERKRKNIREEIPLENLENLFKE